MSYPYILDIVFGSENSTSDSYFIPNLSKNKSPSNPDDPDEPVYHTVSWQSDATYTVSVEGYTPTQSGSTCAISVEDQSVISLSITPTENYVITSYTIDEDTITNPQGTISATVQVTKDIYISATASIIQHTVTLSADNNVDGMSKSAGGWNVNHGSSFDVYAQPKSGYTLDYTCDDNTLVVEDGEVPNSKVFTIPSVAKDCTLSIMGVAISSDNIDVELPTVTNATIQPITQSPVEKGSNFVFRLTPDEGYCIDDVTVDGITLMGIQVGNTDTQEYTITNVTSSPEISVTTAVDTNKFYSQNKQVYGIIEDTDNQLEPKTGRYKINLNAIENQSDKEDLQKIISSDFYVVMEQYTYTSCEPHYTCMGLVDSNLDEVCKENNLTGWEVSVSGYVGIELRKGNRSYYIEFYYDGETDPAQNVVFYGLDTDSVLPWHNYKFAGTACSSHYDTEDHYIGEYYYDSANLNENHEYVSDANWGDTHDLDSMGNIYKISLSNIDQEIATSSDKFYSNGIHVYDMFDETPSKHYGYFMIDLANQNLSGTEKSAVRKVLSELVFVINNYYYAGQNYYEKPQDSNNKEVNNIDQILANNPEINGITIGINPDYLMLYLNITMASSVGLEIPFYVDGEALTSSDQHKFAFYYTRDSNLDIGEYDRTNDDIQEPYTGHNSGEGRSAYEFSFSN